MKKVVIIGPESTGKSTLCEQLADHYKTIYCPEFAREYLADSDGKYTYEDLLSIAMGQVELEDQLLPQAKNGLYFIDTDMYVMKVWSEVAFANCHKFILDKIATRTYDLFLLCNVDLPWVPDDLREYPELHVRQQHFKMYEDLMIESGAKWAVISGTFSERLQSAIHLVDTVLLGKSS